MKDLSTFSDKELYECFMNYYEVVHGYQYIGKKDKFVSRYFEENKGIDIKEGFYDVLVNGDLEYAFSLKELKAQFGLRKLPFPLPLIPAPKTLIIEPIEVKITKKSGIILPDTLAVKDSIEQYHDHPFQARVLSLAKDIEWDGLFIGAILMLKSSMADIIRYEGKTYRYISYSSIIAVI